MDSKRYQRLVPACAERGIGRTVAFDLVKRGLLRAFKIGAATYVFEQSLDELPERLAAEAKAEAAKAGAP